jgi:uncharacterized membrane protein (DUF106 family)
LSAVNAVLRAVFDALLAPFAALPAWVGLTVVSLVVGVIALLVFKQTSNQKALAAVKRQMFAGFFEIRLFNDDFRAILRAQGDILRHNLRYLGLTLVPMAWLLVPLFFVFAQLQFHYGYEGLKLGEPVLLKVELAEDWQQSAGAVAPGHGPADPGTQAERLGSAEADGRPQATLEAPPGIRVEAGPVWIPAQRELAWRIAAEKPGDYQLTLRLGAETVTKAARSSDRMARRSPVRTDTTLWKQLLYPAEPPLPAGSAVAAVHLGYPEATVPFLFWDVPWWLVFLILTFVFAYALKGRFGVTI